MKRHIFTCILFSLMLSVGLSCKKNEQTNQESPTIYSRSVKYQFYTSGATGNNNYSVSYTGSNGANIVEPITLTANNQTWTSNAISIPDIRVLPSVSVKVSSATISTATTVTINIVGGNDSSVILSKNTYTFTSTAHDGTTTYTF